MRKLAPWIVRSALGVLATCGFVTCKHEVPGPAINPHREAGPVSPRPKPVPLGVERAAMPPSELDVTGDELPYAVAPKKPPRDAGGDGIAPLPPLPDGGLPTLRDSGVPLKEKPRALP